MRCDETSVTKTLTFQVFGESANAAVAHYRAKKSISEGNTANIRVSFDATWSRREHSSNFGLQAAITFDVSSVLDFNLFSTYCVASETQTEPRALKRGFSVWATLY